MSRVPFVKTGSFENIAWFDFLHSLLSSQHTVWLAEKQTDSGWMLLNGGKMLPNSIWLVPRRKSKFLACISPNWCLVCIKGDMVSPTSSKASLEPICNKRKSGMFECSMQWWLTQTCSSGQANVPVAPSLTKESWEFFVFEWGQKNSSMELAVIWGNFGFSNLGCFDLGRSDLGHFFVKILTFFHSIFTTHLTHTQME